MKLDITTLGRPSDVGRHHKRRMILSVIAAVAGAVGILGIVFLAIGTVTPTQAGVAYAVIAVLLAIWLTGIRWRWDSPDRRDPGYERERRGF